MPETIIRPYYPISRVQYIDDIMTIYHMQSLYQDMVNWACGGNQI